MAFKTHLDRENRPWYCIPTRPWKCKNCVNMHRNLRRTSLYLPVPELRHHTHTRIIHHHQWGRNISWERSPCRHVMGSNKPPVASYTLTSQGGLYTWLRHTSQGRPNDRKYQIKGGPNGWINLWNHQHYHFLPMLGRARQKCILLVIHTISRLLHPYEPLKRDDPSHSASFREKVIFLNTRIV